MIKEKLKRANEEDQDLIKVNTSASGSHHYKVTLWSGVGSLSQSYSVWATDENDAVDNVAAYCKRNEPGMVVSEDVIYQEMVEYMSREIEEDPEKFGFTENQVMNSTDEDLISDLRENDEEKYWDLWDQTWYESGLEQMYLRVDDPSIFVGAENLAIEEISE